MSPRVGAMGRILTRFSCERVVKWAWLTTCRCTRRATSESISRTITQAARSTRLRNARISRPASRRVSCGAILQCPVCAARVQALRSLGDVSLAAQIAQDDEQPWPQQHAGDGGEPVVGHLRGIARDPAYPGHEEQV